VRPGGGGGGGRIHIEVGRDELAGWASVSGGEADTDHGAQRGQPGVVERLEHRDGAVAEIDGKLVFVRVSFSTDPVITGFSLPVAASTISREVTAAVAPAWAADRIGFAISDSSRAAVDIVGCNTGTGVVSMKVRGLSATPGNIPGGDAELEAQAGQQKINSAKVIVVVPTSQSHSVGPTRMRNFAQPSSWPGLYYPGTEVLGIVTITILDQFGNPLDPIYDGMNAVTETFSPATGYLQTIPPNSVITLPTGRLSSGVVEDQCGYERYIQLAQPDCMNAAEANNWQQDPPTHTYTVQGVACNNVFEMMGTGAFPLIPLSDCHGTGTQRITVYGHTITPTYDRVMNALGQHYPPVPFTLTDTPGTP
jgi:hypothetical protein